MTTAMERKVTFKLGDGVFSRDVAGETFFGDDHVLLDKDDNLLAGAPFEPQGYVVGKLFDSADDYVALQRCLTGELRRIMKEVGITTPDDFRIEQYHTFVDDKTHDEVAKKIQSGFSMSIFPFPVDTIEKRVSALIGTKVACRYRKHEPERKFNLRVVRPKSNDNNPPHRDVWLDHLRDAVNIYVPLAGSSAESSLPIVPGSHHWMESEIERTRAGARMGGQTFTVPCVTAAKRDVHFVRPNPGPNELLVFSPYLIHGGGVNFQGEVTRASLEARFWRG